jgi:phage baseplate assembly protein gpV
MAADERANVALEDFTRLSLSDWRMWVTRQSGDVRSASEPHHLGLVVSFFVAWGSSMAVVVADLLTGGDETVPDWLAAVAGAAVVAASWRLYCAMRDDDL